MATTIQPVVGEMSSTPINGEPWDFNGILESCLIPYTVLRDEKLLLGARVLWGIIRQFSFQDGRCYASDETLAQMLAVSDRHIRNYARALESAGLLRTTQRPGKTPIRELLWAERFAGKIRKRTELQFRGGGTTVPGGRNYSSGTSINKGVLNGVTEVTRASELKKPWAPEAEQRANKPAAEWTEEDYIRRGRECGFPDYIIERDLENMRKRKANVKAERMLKASEIPPERPASARR